MMFRKLFIDPEIAKEVENRLSGQTPKSEPIYTRSRATRIDIDFLDLTFYVYNGQKYLPLSITEDHVGYCLGEFIPTRKDGNEKARKNKKQLEKRQEKKQTKK